MIGDQLAAAADYREVLQLLDVLEASLDPEDPLAWSDMTIPEIAEIATTSGALRLAGLLLSLRRLHSRDWRIETTALSKEDVREGWEASFRHWEAKGWSVLAADEYSAGFSILLSREAPLTSESYLWESGVHARGSDVEAEQFAASLGALRSEHAPALVGELYRLNRTTALVHGRKMLDLQDHAIQVAVSASLSPSRRRKEELGVGPRRGASLDVLVRGANALATPQGARTLIDRCAAAGVREGTRHADDMELAQWLTFIHLLCVAGGAGDPPPDAREAAGPIFEALRGAISHAGDDVLLGQGE